MFKQCGEKDEPEREREEEIGKVQKCHALQGGSGRGRIRRRGGCRQRWQHGGRLLPVPRRRQGMRECEVWSDSAFLIHETWSMGCPAAVAHQGNPVGKDAANSGTLTKGWACSGPGAEPSVCREESAPSGRNKASVFLYDIKTRSACMRT